jgi:hypothetical protein
MAAAHKPQLCRKSLKMAKENLNSSFLERTRQAAMRKEQANMQRKAHARASDPEHTFQPRINSSSRRLPPRSVDDMSRGDAMRRETAVRMMKLKLDQDKLAGLTFQPKTTRKGQYADVEGRLRVTSEPETYIERVQREAQLLSEKQRRALEDAEREEFSECTFQPEVHDAPAYVKRIARSMALTRAARGAGSVAEEKPQWR